MTRRKPKLALAAPETFEELVERGGPAAYIRQAEALAGDAEAWDWLATLEAHRPRADDVEAIALIAEWLKPLRRRLGVRKPPDHDKMRAGARERQRRFRARHPRKEIA